MTALQKSYHRRDTFRAYYELRVWDKDGKIIHRSGLRRSHSFVQQFLELIMVSMRQVGISIKDTGGTDRTQNVSTAILRARGLVNQDNEGILIGTSATAEAIDDNDMTAQIADGTNTGEMVYQAQVTDSSGTTSAPNFSWSMTRNFSNNSGGTITVREIGIEVSANFQFLVLHDTPIAVAVPDGGGCQVTYTIQVSV